MLPETGLAVFYGPPSCGKSFLVLDLALALTKGDTHWFGWKITPCPVCYINLESSWGLQGRLRAWRKNGRCEVPSNLKFITDNFNLFDTSHIDALLQHASKNSLIIIDTMSRATPGGDENSSKDMGTVIYAASEIQKKTSSLVLLVAHSGKDSTKGLRGHSSLGGAIDTSVEVNRKNGNRRIKITKAKEAEDGTEKSFILKPVTIGRDDTDGAITSCVVEYVGDAAKSVKEFTEAMRDALESLHIACKKSHHDEVCLKEWREEFYKKHSAGKKDTLRKSFARAIGKLLEQGKIVEHGDSYAPA